MRDTSWMNNPTLRNIDPKKLGILLELVNDTEGKPADKILPYLIATNTKLKSQGLSFTSDETDLMLSILMKDLSEEEKKKIEMVKKMIKK